MEYQDDRTKEQKTTHKYLVTATDRFMSGWGRCKNGNSKCAWACDNMEYANKIFYWVKNRHEMKYVNLHTGNWYPKNAKHVQIYVVDNTHPGLKY